MKSLTKVLLKIVARGFYQTHTGLLLTLLVVVFSNFFYTNVLNQTHLTRQGLIQNALKLVLTAVSEPLGAAGLASLFLGYSFKSGQYVKGRLQQPDVRFLFYSLGALSGPRQRQAWALVQLVINLPLLVMGGFALLVGLRFGYWLVPLLIPVYLLGLTLASARYYAGLINHGARAAGGRRHRPAWLGGWPKPLFSLFVYELLLHRRVVYGVTKVGAASSLAFLISVLPEAKADARLLGWLGLGVALAHVVVLYQAAEFERVYLRFARNWPLRFDQLCYQQLGLHAVLLLPELGWLLGWGGLKQGLLGGSVLLSTALLFSALAGGPLRRMQPYLRVVFGLFTGAGVLILFGLTPWVALGNAGAAGWLLHRYRYRLPSS